jgi:dolichyl-phosphate beta-glucosyltransferase
MCYCEAMPHLSIIIPCYNEAKRLPESLVLMRNFLEEQSYEYEVLAVDDGSTDDTVAVIRKAAKKFPQLRLIQLEKNQGKGAAVQRGMQEATGQLCLFTDADYSTPLSEIEKLLPFTSSHAVVIGSRYLSPHSVKVKQPLSRRIISRSCNGLIQVLLLPGIRDTQCGFKLFTKAAAQEIFPNLTMAGWSFDVEILSLAKQKGLPIQEVAVDWFDAKHSTLRARSGALPFLRDIFTLTRRKKKS